MDLFNDHVNEYYFEELIKYLDFFQYEKICFIIKHNIILHLHFIHPTLNMNLNSLENQPKLYYLSLIYFLG